MYEGRTSWKREMKRQILTQGNEKKEGEGRENKIE